MNILPASSSQPPWEEIRQETMRNTSKTDPAESEARTAATSDVQAPDADNTAQVLELIKAKQKKKRSSSASQENLSTSLENVGPNTFERIRQNAGKTYLAQAMAFTAENNDPVTAGLHKST